MKKFIITESERKHIKSLYVTKGILNEGIPGLTSVLRIGMKQGLKDSSKAEIKKLLKTSFPNENVDDVYEKFEFEYLHARDTDDVVEKYFKNVEDDEVRNFCRILAKEDPGKFAKYSLEAVSNHNTTIVIRYAVEHPEKYNLEQLEKIDRIYRNIVNNLDESDPFTSEVKNNLETQYGNKLKQHIESKKGTNSKPVEKPAEQTPTAPKPDEQVKPQTGISRGNFTVRKLNDGSKIAKFMDSFFEKVFYEGNNKVMNGFPKEVIKQFTPETKSYLLQLLDIVKQKNLTSGLEQGFRADYGRLPKTVDEEIEFLSNNFWGGKSQYGNGGRRQGGIQGILDEAPVPSPNVMDNLMNVTMSPNQREELMEYGYKIGAFKKEN